jgi:hypothetical protein
MRAIVGTLLEKEKEKQKIMKNDRQHKENRGEKNIDSLLVLQRRVFLNYALRTFQILSFGSFTKAWQN